MNPLDLYVIRTALHDARREVEAGRSPEDAVSRVCRGAWAPYAPDVYVALVHCVALPSLAHPLRHLPPANAPRDVGSRRRTRDLP